jgi:hypothetical protein
MSSPSFDGSRSLPPNTVPTGLEVATSPETDELRGRIGTARAGLKSDRAPYGRATDRQPVALTRAASRTVAVATASAGRTGTGLPERTAAANCS